MKLVISCWRCHQQLQVRQSRKQFLRKETGNTVEIHVQNHHSCPVGRTPFWLHSTCRVTISGNEKNNPAFSFPLYHCCFHRVVAPWFESLRDLGRFWLRTGQRLFGWRHGRKKSGDSARTIESYVVMFIMGIHSSREIILEIPCCYALVGELLESWGCGLLKTEVLKCDAFLFGYSHVILS